MNALKLFFACLAVAAATFPTYPSYCVTSKDAKEGQQKCKGDVFLKGKYIEVGIHNVGSFGTQYNAPYGFTSRGNKLGFIADYDKNGFTVGTPPYAGDYFVPGSPVEGWQLQWTNSKGVKNLKVNEGLMKDCDILPDTFEITSTSTTQSALWVGKSGEMMIRAVTQFDPETLYFTTSVELENIGSAPVKDVYYVRTVDPDQEQPYYKLYHTYNYVKYQPKAADLSDCCLARNYTHPVYPDAALVAAVGKNKNSLYCGLGAIHPRARVSHYGFYEKNPPMGNALESSDGTWKKYGGNNVSPSDISQMRYADEALHLTFNYPTIGAGEVVQFSYAYILNENDLLLAMESLNGVVISQPTGICSARVCISAVDYVEADECAKTSSSGSWSWGTSGSGSYDKSTHHTHSSSDTGSKAGSSGQCEFEVYGVKPGKYDTAKWYDAGKSYTSSGVCSACFDSTEFLQGSDLSLKVRLKRGGKYYYAYKSCRVQNEGVKLKYIQTTDVNCSFPFYTTKSTVLNMTKEVPTATDPDYIMFYREVYVAGEVKSQFIGKVIKPWAVTVSVADLVAGSKVHVKAVVYSDGGKNVQTVVFCGTVVHINNPPSSISVDKLDVLECATPGTVIGKISSTDPDSAFRHTYSLVDNAGGLIGLNGSNLVLLGSPDYETKSKLTIRIRADDGHTSSCCFEKDFTITVKDCNEAPLSCGPLLFYVYENAPVYHSVGYIKATDPDTADTHTYAFLTTSSTFAVGSTTGQITVIGTLSYETKNVYYFPTRCTDSGSPSLAIDVTVEIRVLDVNDCPTDITFGGSLSIDENTAIGTSLGKFSAVDADVGDTHTFSLSNSAGGMFSVTSDGYLKVAGLIDYETTGSAVMITVKVVDRNGCAFEKNIYITIIDVYEPPSSCASVTCYVDENRRVGDTVVSTKDNIICRVSGASTDSSELSYSIISNTTITGNYKYAFKVESCSGVMYLNNTLDYKTKGEYNLQVLVTSKGGTCIVKLKIIVVNINKAPSMIASTYSIYENSAVHTEITSSLVDKVYDPDDVGGTSPFCCEKRFMIESGNSDGFFYISNEFTGAIKVAKLGLNYEIRNQYVLIVRVTDKGGLFVSAPVTINILDINEPPTLACPTGIYAYLEECCTIGAKVGLGIVGTDVDAGQTLSYAITGGNTGNTFKLSSYYDSVTKLTYQYITLNSCVSYASTPSFSLIVTVSDSGSPVLSSACTYVVAIKNVNKPPTLVTPLVFTIVENSAQYTEVGTPLKNHWTDPDAGDTAIFTIIDYGSDGAKFFAINSATGQLYLNKHYLNYEETPTFTYKVQVIDSGGLTAVSTVTINVIDLQEWPWFHTLPTGQVLENKPISPEHYVVTSDDQVIVYRAHDDDGDDLTWTILSINGVESDSWMFKIDKLSSTTMRFIVNNVFDYEAQNVYNVYMSISDGERKNYMSAIVNIIDVNDAPTCGTWTCYLAENAPSGTEICSISASDKDSTSKSWGVLNYTLTSSTSNVAVTTSANVGKLSLISACAWARDSTISDVLVTVTDGGGLSSTCSVTIKVKSANVAPKCPTSPVTFTLAENSPAGTVVGTVLGADASRYITDTSALTVTISAGNVGNVFTLDSGTGVLKTTSVSTNYEALSSYSLAIQAVQMISSPLTTTCAFNVVITDVNEDTTCNNQVFYVDENIDAGYLTVNNVPNGPVVVIDEDPADQYGLFSIVCIKCDADPFSINATTGMISLKTGFTLNYEKFNNYSYQLHWTSRGVSKSSIVTIIVIDKPEAPFIKPCAFSLPETSVVGTVVGYVPVMDPDYEKIIDFSTLTCKGNCNLRYVILSSTSHFTVDYYTGEIKVSATGCDFEDTTRHTITVQVTDINGLVDTDTCVLDVTDVADCEVTTLTDLSGNVISSASTAGGMQMLINGRNFGPSKARMSAEGISASQVTVSAMLQSNADGTLANYKYSMNCDVRRVGSLDNTQLNCTVPPGVGTNLGAIITVTTNYPSGPSSCTTGFSVGRMSYAKPTITAITSCVDVPCGGGSNVYITGTNFGAVGSYNLVKGSYSNSYCFDSVTCTVITPHTVLKCVTGPGYGSNVHWYVTVGAQVSNTFTDSCAYAPPAISKITAPLLNTWGGDKFIIEGSNFGDVATRIHVTYGATGYEMTASCVILTSQTKLECTSIAGIGKDLKVIVKVADLTSAVFENALHYKPPVLDQVMGPGAALANTQGGDIVYLIGSQFGDISISGTQIVVTYGKTGTEYTATNCRVEASHTKVQCLTVPGTGRGLQWQIYIATQASNLLNANTSYSPPMISYFGGSGSTGADCGGYQLVYIYGTNFGASMATVDSVYYTRSTNTTIKFVVTANCTMHTPHKVLACYTVPGAGASLIWTVIVDEQKSVAPTTSYGAPYITSLEGPGTTNASVYGGQYVTIHGGNFGPPDGYAGCVFLDWVKYGISGSEYTAQECYVVSNTVIQCKTAQGVGRDLVWAVSVGGQVSATSTQTTWYAKPNIIYLSPDYCYTSGTSTISVYGTNLATFAGPVVNFVNTTIASSVVSTEVLAFTCPEAVSVTQLLYPISVSVGGQTSNVKNFRYLPPYITAVNMYEVGSGMIRLVILGTSFSLKGIVRIRDLETGNVITPYCSYKYHTEINCEVSVKQGNVTVSTDVATSNWVQFTYGEPTMLKSELVGSGTSKTSGYTASNPVTLKLTGQNCGISADNTKVIIENRDTGAQGQCAIISITNVARGTTEWSSLYTSITGADATLDFQIIQCKVPPGQGKDNSIKVVRGAAYSMGCGCDSCRVSACFSYLAPYITSVTPILGSTTGGYPLVIKGDNFGLTRTLNVGPLMWTVNTALSNHTHLIATVPAYEGKDHLITINVGGQVNNVNPVQVGFYYFSYNAPVIYTSISSWIVGVAGSSTPVSISGAHFGTLGPICHLGSERVTILSFSHTSLTILIPPGVGAGMKLSCNVSSQIGLSPDDFSYKCPNITSVSPLTSDTSGGRASNVIITIRGTNLGLSNKAYKIFLGDVEVLAEDIISFNSTMARFYAPSGQGVDLVVRIQAGNQDSCGQIFKFNYNPPELEETDCGDMPKSTKGGYKVKIKGRNMGSKGCKVYVKDKKCKGCDGSKTSGDSGSKGTSGGAGTSGITGGSASTIAIDNMVGATLTYDTAGAATFAKPSGYVGRRMYESPNIIAAGDVTDYHMPPTPCEIVSQNDTEVVCVMPPGAGADLVLSVEVGGYVAEIPFSYDPPAVSHYYLGSGGDALGETVRIYGYNFGSFRTPVNITIGGKECKFGVWLADDPVYDFEPYLQCFTPKLTVGAKEVVVTVAYQTAAVDNRFQVACKSGSFGGSGEYCYFCGDPALTGYVCDSDGLYSPMSAPGWYLSMETVPSPDCPAETQTMRTVCPAAVPCIPKESCLGNNTCSTGYKGDRCALCSGGFYKINGRCQPCPDAPWVIVFMAILIALTGGYIAYKLHKKNVSLGILSIGIDYFQVLAIFGSANVVWPQSLTNLYNLFSVFNFNIDVAAPDCWNDNLTVSFKDKWIAITVFPIITLAVCGMAFGAYAAYCYVVKSRRRGFMDPLCKFIAFYLMVFYYAYLMLSNNTLAVFNCQPTEPSDGYRYMAEVGADGGRCYKEGTLQQELEPWAVLAFIFYTIGFPGFVGYMLFTNRDKVMHAQVLRAAGKTDDVTLTEKQNVMRFRMMFNRMYYQFKPEYFFWVFCILLRKFSLSLSAVIFRENTVFLLALYLLILFCSYTAQVRHMPYMSTSEYEDVMEKYSYMLQEHQQIVVAAAQRRHTLKMKAARLGADGPIFQALAPQLSFFNNYNTVESYMLFSAILINIAALMFESQQLSGTQQDSLAYLVIIIVTLSLAYFFWILFSEIWVAFYPERELLCIRHRRENDDELVYKDVEFSDINFENPMGRDDNEGDTVQQLQMKLARAEKKLADLQREEGSSRSPALSPKPVAMGMATSSGYNKPKPKRMLQQRDSLIEYMDDDGDEEDL